MPLREVERLGDRLAQVAVSLRRRQVLGDKGDVSQVTDRVARPVEGSRGQEAVVEIEARDPEVCSGQQLFEPGDLGRYCRGEARVQAGPALPAGTTS